VEQALRFVELAQSRLAMGARPSSVAAAQVTGTREDISQPIVRADAAATEDGRTPPGR
jgi:hypothetical protein